LNSLLVSAAFAIVPPPEARSVESAIETETSQVALPTSPGDPITVTQCAHCAPLRLPTDEHTRWMVGNDAVTLADLRSQFIGGNRPVTLFVSRTTGHLTRVRLPQSRPAGGTTP
jgi:hypothetical protein